MWNRSKGVSFDFSLQNLYISYFFSILTFKFLLDQFLQQGLRPELNRSHKWPWKHIWEPDGHYFIVQSGFEAWKPLFIMFIESKLTWNRCFPWFFQPPYPPHYPARVSGSHEWGALPGGCLPRWWKLVPWGLREKNMGREWKKYFQKTWKFLARFWN